MISSSLRSLKKHKKQFTTAKTLDQRLAMDVIYAFQIRLISGKSQYQRFVRHTRTDYIKRIAESLGKNSMAVRQIEALLRFANGKCGSWYSNENRVERKFKTHKYDAIFQCSIDL